MTPTSVRIKGGRSPKANTSSGTHEAVAELILRHGGGKVLDAPCGEGALAWRLAQRGCEMWCLDCDAGVPRIEGVEFHVGDLQQRLPYDDGCFDCVACVDGIEHLENPFHVIREFGRVLRPGGLLVVSTPNVSSIRSRFRFLMSGFHSKFKRPPDEAKPSPRHHLAPISFPWLRYMLHTNGFRIRAARANRVKLASLPFAVLYPVSALYAALSFARNDDPARRRRDWEVFRTLFSAAVFFGETLIVAAEKLGVADRGAGP
ncbi:MAG TPA: class I SAM-dependent methyltransferase [Planctomycetota bacterium]|nr:class I SAM-dependent methyltransferase [Planctomycetota bacterium]